MDTIYQIHYRPGYPINAPVQVVGTHKCAKRARHKCDRLDNKVGGYQHKVFDLTHGRYV